MQPLVARDEGPDGRLASPAAKLDGTLGKVRVTGEKRKEERARNRGEGGSDGEEREREKEETEGNDKWV